MDYQIRMAAFKWLEEQLLLHGDLLPRTVLEEGIYFGSKRITLVGPQGIWKPKALELPLSITTVADGPYDDAISTEGFLKYRYRGRDVNHRDNVGLRETMRNRTPLIYFLGVEPGRYLAEWPVFIVGDLPHELTFRVLIDEKSTVDHYREAEPGEASQLFNEAADYRREYITGQAMIRLHQRVFRARVLTAYQSSVLFTDCSMQSF